jgi:hypothetical protein
VSTASNRRTKRITLKDGREFEVDLILSPSDPDLGIEPEWCGWQAAQIVDGAVVVCEPWDVPLEAFREAEVACNGEGVKS